MEELIKLAEAGYIVELLVEDSADHDFAVAITKKGEPTTTTTFIDRSTFDAADEDEKVKLIDDTFLSAKKELDGVLLDDENMMIDRMD